MSVKHAKVSQRPDTSDSSIIQASDWNADHVDGNGNALPTYSYDSSGNVVGLAGPNGVIRLGSKLQTPGAVICDWQPATGTLAMISTDAGDEVALDTTLWVDGYNPIKCTFSNAASGTYIAEFAFTNAISLKNFKTIQIPIKITSNVAASGIGLSATPLGVWLYLSGGGTVRLFNNFDSVPPGAWHTFSFSRYSAAGLVQFASGASAWTDVDSQTITKVRIVQATVAASVNYPVWVGPIRADARTVGRVSIVMDGEYSSQYTILKPILDGYGFKTSLAITYSDIGDAGRMTEAQIDEMYNNGHECIHHTYDATKTNGYVNATDWASAAAIADDIRDQWNYFLTKGWTRGIGKAVSAFVQPYTNGIAEARQRLILAAMKAAGVECHRESGNLYTTQMSLGNKATKPFMLRGAIMITNTHTAANVQAVIDQAEANGEWAIITIHRAVASGPASLEMTTADFQTWLDYLNTRVQAGGVQVQPLGEVFDECFH